MTSGKWMRNFIGAVILITALLGAAVAVLDPFFHYHAPLSGFYYRLADQRSQNDGITRHFFYDAMITGTSNTDNFKTSEFDALFGVSSIKVPYPGASFHEVSANMEKGLSSHNVTIVVRSVDDSYLIESAGAMHSDMGEFPTYLYDSNPFNDIRYYLNRDVLFGYCLPMIKNRITGAAGGVESFDSYSADDPDTQYGREQALDGVDGFPAPSRQQPLTQSEAQMVRDNVTKNIVEPAKAHPETTFYCFIPPFSIVRWGTMWSEGTLERQIKAQRIAMSLMLECANIKLFSFSDNTDLITDLSNYKDAVHYSPEVSSELLRWMKDGRYQVTKDNMDELLSFEEKFYENYNYQSLMDESSSD